MFSRISMVKTIAAAVGVVFTPQLLAQSPPEPVAIPAEAGSAQGHGTTGEVVYNVTYSDAYPRFMGQYTPGYIDDLHLTRAGNLVCFTISVFNASANPSFYGTSGTYVSVDALVQFYSAPPVAGVGFPGGSLLAEYHVEIPPPQDAFGTVWTITTDLITPVPVPQDIWVSVTTPLARNGPYSYAGPVFLGAPAAPDVGSTVAGIWAGVGFYSFIAIDYAQAITIRLAEGNQPPVITCGTAAVLWSPHHDFVDISSSLFSVADPDTPAENLTVDVMVVSDETEIPETGDGTGKHAPDFKTQLASGASGFFLRSERQGPGDGRVYLVIVTASDGVNTVTTVCVAAVTPHDETTESMLQALMEADDRAAALQADIDLVGLGSVNLAAHGLSQHGVSGQLGPKQ